jgi:hypothetical protein
MKFSLKNLTAAQKEEKNLQNLIVTPIKELTEDDLNLMAGGSSERLYER